MDLTAAWDLNLGDFTIIDLIAATTNAFNGALLARQPSHYRKYTVVGILLLAIFGGIGGGVSRDVLLNDIPSALTNPLYLILCAVAGFLALRISGRLDEARTARLFDFMSAFSLPWYAAVGCNKALEARSAVPGVHPHRGRRSDRRAVPDRHHLGGDPAALRPGRVVRRHRGPDERRLHHRGRGIRTDDLAGDAHRVRGRLHVPLSLEAYAVGGAPPEEPGGSCRPELINDPAFTKED